MKMLSQQLFLRILKTLRFQSLKRGADIKLNWSQKQNETNPSRSFSPMTTMRKHFKHRGEAVLRKHLRKLFKKQKIEEFFRKKFFDEGLR